ncbi:methylated-DNA--[protein]-cysteine S-methyltransferase [Hymenobacter sp. BRD128]|uniref:methylated-DNA--[protein]-cysteine S-methyltransferase n=1 Tax=Hymenobacter sp. BRD128 TaxID=2675878 RepID=UPI0015633E4A|nr:methylated-DNA--[protein]-cysteine S-methyltransferase [Hymenobacter sp. BRD128]QKG58497.1 methylated-DNA--[protein]-cysteine S-methyltransferase [Hymenobacter sp. BRD128]
MQAVAHLYSPIGMVALHGSDAGLHAVQFLDHDVPPPTALADVAACLQEPHRQLQAYFNRELREFKLQCEPLAGTEFQRQVWAALASIAHGRTASYLDVAKLLNNPKSVRAVGAANGQNPLAIVWPCHRVIGASGALTGYAGGLVRKQWLLAFEQPERQGALFG